MFAQNSTVGGLKIPYNSEELNTRDNTKRKREICNDKGVERRKEGKGDVSAIQQVGGGG